MTPAPPISYMWSRLYDIETTQLKREAQSEASGMRGEVLYQTRGRGGNSFRGRGRAGANRGGRAIQVQSESCFRCGETDHWSKECPKKESTHSWRYRREVIGSSKIPVDYLFGKRHGSRDDHYLDCHHRRYECL